MSLRSTLTATQPPPSFFLFGKILAVTFWKKSKCQSSYRVGLHIFALMSTITLALLPLALAAQISPPSDTEDAREAHIYRLLFRQVMAYERLASEADAADLPKPYLRRILVNRLHLSETDSASLLRLALAYQVELVPLRQEIVKEKAASRAYFPLGLKPPGMNGKSPAILNDLHAQEDRITLRYRDLLRNDLGSNSFQHMVTWLYRSFGQNQPELP